MLGKYVVFLVLHLICTYVLLRIFNSILPCCITCFYTCTANFLMYLLVAGLTFRFTKKKYLNEKLQPYNRAVLITGCDSGFGHLLAKQLDSQGFHVFASCLNPDGEGAQELSINCSKRLLVFGLDVRSDESVKKALEFVLKNLGTSELWAIVNNAGLHKGFSVELSSLEDFRDSVDVNTLGPVRVTKAFLPLLRQSRGRVVNLTSISGRLPGPHATPYCMSKYAFVGLNDCLRQELEIWGIKVISIEPELFKTTMTNGKRLIKCVESTFENVEESIKSDYGEKYMNNFKFFVEYYSKMSSSKVCNVISDLEKAVSLKYPDSIYRPSRNFFILCGLYVYEMLPHVLRDMTLKLALFAVGFPKPLEASNS